ncbi:endonuclease V [Clostridium saccharoperbutylacetonicum]|uniref:endonuclease V n=1 Tax=Clostridium saccharoperbutylacetonicum TaxID=36745 RepID=UPI000983EE8E|nr:endonuclease V [Clostridium saccharoperbutylacetonicum]AQR96255.1 endonuclease V [Clostridium saccharoperbutylacetonicum]NSB32128.1 deoxyribonuclease V [Clostridium saccharoperbutylacetonicum]
MENTDFKFVSEEKCREIQANLKAKIVKNNTFELEDIRYIAGVDLAYWKDAVEKAVCCIVVLDYATGEIVEEINCVGEINFPYISGYLAFRELPLVMECNEKLSVKPDLYVFDGNGYLHPRHMGIATHASFYLDKPTIGVAKNYYKIEDVDFVMPENEQGAFTDIVIDGEVYGRALRTCKDVKPIFISIGNYIDLETTTRIINKLVRKDSHIPIPTRYADIATHKMRSIYR